MIDLMSMDVGGKDIVKMSTKDDEVIVQLNK
ncbi:MAG: hypothetical protein K0R27_276 [Xanthobacteraceae bacterium]|jgi:hypothetical protein|nr:hypothetical protein [Xanthobacteraceae bacterium]